MLSDSPCVDPCLPLGRAAMSLILNIPVRVLERLAMMFVLFYLIIGVDIPAAVVTEGEAWIALSV